MTATGTVISTCTCGNVFQDETYGRNHRVFNLMKTGSGRCTVCSREKSGLGVNETPKTRKVDETSETGTHAERPTRGRKK